MKTTSRRSFALVLGAAAVAVASGCADVDKSATASLSGPTGVVFVTGAGIWTKAGSADVWLITSG